MRKLAFLSMLVAVSMCIFVIEAQIPPITPFVGVKLGLSNVVVLVTIILMGRREAFVVLILRILLSGLVLGQGIGIFYSLSGGIFAWIIMSVLKRPFRNYIWAISVMGAIFHNIGQLFVASVVMGTMMVFSYFPILLISAVITGVLTGVCAQTVISRSKYLNELFFSVR